MKSKVSIIQVIKESLHFYFQKDSFIFIIKLYSILFILFLILHIFGSYKVELLIDRLYKYLFFGEALEITKSDISTILIAILISLTIYIVHPIIKTNTFYYYKSREKNVIKSLIENRKYYAGMIFLYFFILFLYLLVILFIVALYIILFGNSFDKKSYFYFVFSIVFFIIFMIILNKLYLSRVAYIFENISVIKSLKESWEKTSYIDAFKIFILENIADIPLYLTYILSLTVPGFNIIYIAISSFFVYPLTNLFPIFAYEMIFKK